MDNLLNGQSPIAVIPMKGLQRNDDAMKNRGWYKKGPKLCIIH
jgi:hypothetical protein